MTRPRVLLTHPILEPGTSLLHDNCDVVTYPADATPTEASIREHADGCAGILSQLMDPIRDEVLSLPGLRIVANCAVGFDNIDVAAATRHGVMATNTPGVLDETTAEFAFTLLVATARRVAEADRFVRAGRFHGWAIDMLLGHDLYRATLGIVGMGRIGRVLAARVKGFDMRVLYSDAQPAPPEVEKDLNATRVELDELLRESDFISIHTPLTPETTHLVGERELRLMKPTAVLVNTSRGPVVDEAALAEALKQNRIFAAGLDVFEHEPQVSPALLELDNVVLAPHIASASVATRGEMSRLAVTNLLAGLRGETPPNLLNPELAAGRV